MQHASTARRHASDACLCAASPSARQHSYTTHSYIFGASMQLRGCHQRSAHHSYYNRSIHQSTRTRTDMAASVARQQAAAAAVPPATSMMARVDRLDLVLGYLEEMTQHHGRHHTTSAASAATWSPSSTASSSSAASTPRGSKTWRRRPAKEALEEAQAKGTLVDRIALLEDRVLKMEEDMDINITPEKMSASSSGGNRKKGLKSLVKSCVRGKLKTKD